MKVVERVDLKCSHHKKEICDLMEVISNAMAVIILQCISITLIYREREKEQEREERGKGGAAVI